ncbi:hypothetical protein M8J75_010979 [Diaphorina citri]|nr:hypothetical protein M8J75_010979 [Diaphorina citri]
MWDLADEILGSESLVWSVDKMKGRNWDVIEGERTQESSDCIRKDIKSSHATWKSHGLAIRKEVFCLERESGTYISSYNEKNLPSHTRGNISGVMVNAKACFGSGDLWQLVSKPETRPFTFILAATSTGLSVTILARTIIKTSSQAERFGFVFLKFLMSDRNPGHLFSNGETLCIEIKTDNPTTIKQLAD